MIRAAWSERMGVVAESLDFEREFNGSGRAFVEADEDGNVATRGPVR